MASAKKKTKKPAVSEPPNWGALLEDVVLLKLSALDFARRTNDPKLASVCRSIDALLTFAGIAQGCSVTNETCQKVEAALAGVLLNVPELADIASVTQLQRGTRAGRGSPKTSMLDALVSELEFRRKHGAEHDCERIAVFVMRSFLAEWPSFKAKSDSRSELTRLATVAVERQPPEEYEKIITAVARAIGVPNASKLFDYRGKAAKRG